MGARRGFTVKGTPRYNHQGYICGHDFTITVNGRMAKEIGYDLYNPLCYSKSSQVAIKLISAMNKAARRTVRHNHARRRFAAEVERRAARAKQG